MKIKFSSHAIERIRERGIKPSDIEQFIKSPDKIEISRVNERRFLVKKIYYNQKHDKIHLLMIICEQEYNFLKIITIIDTSKIAKYL